MRDLASSAVPFSLSTLAVALLPKCPVCLAALLGLLGVSLPASGAALVGASALLLCVPVGLLASPSGGRRRAGPLGLGCASALLILCGKGLGLSPGVLAAGAAGLAAAFVWKNLGWKKEISHGGCCGSADVDGVVPAAEAAGRAGAAGGGQP
jgi:hypothetical protein